jgi:hypothetical protein
MSNYNVNDEIDQLVDAMFDKIAGTLKDKLKKIVLKSEKILLRQYVASQKETAKLTKTKNDSVSKNPAPKKKRAVKKKNLDYSSMSESDYSESE